MDRISALRNVEDALSDFEAGEATLDATEERVRSVLRSYATDFDARERFAYRAHGDDRVEGVVVVATSPGKARERVRDLVDGGRVDSVERLD
ncbi:hypothetical protein [Halospeciosus flavus]|uniref:Uncharacterized protein n=1 Tax=Halospeciosus flavus TaxID=3032283 RepID=A0ABD5Z7Q8_9EURY|nr:hypothetical protein [Halospeciosus flavus]